MTTGTVSDDFRTTVVSPPPVTAVSGVGSWFTKTWIGGDGPKVRNRSIPTPHVSRRGKSRGEHAYSMSVESGVCAIYRRTQGGPVQWNSTGSTLRANPVSGWNGNDDLNLILRLRSLMQGSDFDMSVFLGTSHQSLRMIGDTAITLGSVYRSIRKGDMVQAARDLGVGSKRHKNRPAARTADEMSRRTLELRYGWLPLLQDMHDGAQFVASQLNTPMVQRYRVSLKRDQIAPPRPPSGYYPAREFGYKRVGLIAIVKENPSMIAKLGLTSPSNLAWELLPWSFVADWVLPIGDYLQARSFVGSLSASYVRSSKTFGYQEGLVSVGSQASILTPPLNWPYVKRVAFTREILASLNVPLPQVKSMGKIASVAHAINGIALMTQQILGIRKTLR